MSARIALFHVFDMPAERGSAAISDCFESLSLVSANRKAPLREEFLFVCAENIGYF
jgi:hypothetical protein